MNDLPTVAMVVHELLSLMSADRIVVTTSVDRPDVRQTLTDLVPAGNLIVGGDTAHASLHAALRRLNDRSPRLPADTTVVVVDPSLSDQSLALVIDTSRAHGGAAVVPVVPMTETVKQLDEDGWIVATVPREHLVQVQRPQVAALGALRARHANCDPNALPALLNLVGTSADTLLVRGTTPARAR